jgi:hypothetical protein
VEISLLTHKYSLLLEGFDAPGTLDSLASFSICETGSLFPKGCASASVAWHDTRIVCSFEGVSYSLWTFLVYL